MGCLLSEVSVPGKAEGACWITAIAAGNSKAFSAALHQQGAMGGLI